MDSWRCLKERINKTGKGNVKGASKKQNQIYQISKAHNLLLQKMD
jgi:hypothetical protein